MTLQASTVKAAIKTGLLIGAAAASAVAGALVTGGKSKAAEQPAALATQADMAELRKHIDDRFDKMIDKIEGVDRRVGHLEGWVDGSSRSDK